MSNLHITVIESFGFLWKLLLWICIADLELEAFITENDKWIALDSHNKLRSMHFADALLWSNQLEKAAEDRVSVLLFQNQNLDSQLVESKSYNENSFVSNNHIGVSKVIKYWYEKGGNYTYNENDRSAPSFTQIIWKDTKYVGCATKSNDHNYAVICYYEPGGNNDNIFQRNVFPPMAPVVIEESEDEIYPFLTKKIIRKRNKQKQIAN
ncbi:uncharacterized protein LOC105845933 isoform X1 [Hydra vulgaris]|uniref:Uncharacterized protein LOC105845933 isoform X1 n=1 Tax=Hydra vulgaris TaxID=6087 RepID=A0ABM4DFA4_HYDVU